MGLLDSKTMKAAVGGFFAGVGEGWSDELTATIKSKREEGMLRLRDKMERARQADQNEFQLERDTTQRDFQSGESAATRDHQAGRDQFAVDNRAPVAVSGTTTGLLGASGEVRSLPHEVLVERDRTALRKTMAEFGQKPIKYTDDQLQVQYRLPTPKEIADHRASILVDYPRLSGPDTGTPLLSPKPQDETSVLDFAAGQQRPPDAERAGTGGREAPSRVPEPTPLGSREESVASAVAAYRKATTNAQRKAILDRARTMGVDTDVLGALKLPSRANPTLPAVSL